MRPKKENLSQDEILAKPAHYTQVVSAGNDAPLFLGTLICAADTWASERFSPEWESSPLWEI